MGLQEGHFRCVLGVGAIATLFGVGDLRRLLGGRGYIVGLLDMEGWEEGRRAKAVNL